MEDIKVKRYANPKNVGGWLGWIEPEDKRWILFVHTDGTLSLFEHRDEKGGVIGNASNFC